MWRRKGAQITNDHGKVFDVQGSVDAEDRYVLAWKRHGQLNQQFDVIYHDEWKRDPIKGELNKEYGLYVERPFYIITRMGSGRYLDLINNKNFVVKTRNGRRTQIWWFDQKTLTIKSKLNSYSWDIVNSGRGRDMQIYSTNSRWW
jgi:hypothetical protein